MGNDEEVLHGGVANAGAVVRVGDQVLRPAGPHSATIHALLRHVRATGFEGVPAPLGVEPGGRERLSFIPGEVPGPPFPDWSKSDRALASTAVLLRRFHDATVGFVPPEGATWNHELADPMGGDVVCHNDVCLENVVFRDGVAVGLLDFEFAAPGRRLFDVGAFARVFVPLDTPDYAARTGRAGLDPFRRLRVVADAYGLDRDRSDLIEVIRMQMARGHLFVERRAEAGEEAFVAMWHELGGRRRFERRQDWFEANAQRFLDAVG